MCMRVFQRSDWRFKMARVGKGGRKDGGFVKEAPNLKDKMTAKPNIPPPPQKPSHMYNQDR